MRRRQQEEKRQQQQQQGGVIREKEYLNFINSLRSKATIKVYRLSINNYMRFIKTSNISSLLKQDHKTIESQIISYLVDMRGNQNLSYASLSLRLAALKKFYEMNDVVLNWKKVSVYQSLQR
jgi:site-specific recombinase XerD